jgi:competence protein ComEA
MTVQLSINTATATKLETLPGIGPSLAKRIIDYRDQNGAFKRIEDLKNVKGIGDNLLQKVLPYIKL